MKYICSHNVLIGDKFEPASIGFEAGIIKEIKEYGLGHDYGYNYIIPGLIEIHTHGGKGFETMEPDIDKYQEWLAYLPKTGVTSLLVSPYTAEISVFKESVDFLNKHSKITIGSEVLGLHLEGPFLNKEHGGAMDSQYIINPSVEIFNEIVGNNMESVKLVTLAPEKDLEYEFTQYLQTHNIVASAGHTAITYEQLKKDKPKNLKSFTHTFNGMLGLHHREVGTVGAALLDDEFYTELICDGIHVSFDAARILFKSKPKDKMILITDAISVMGLEKGTYVLNGLEVEYDGSMAYLKGTNKLAGSTIPLVECVRNAHFICGVDLVSSILAATINPATLIGVDKVKGSIEVGKHSDLCVLDQNLNLLETITKGRFNLNTIK